MFPDPFDRIVNTFLENKNRLPGKKIVVYEFADISGRVKPEGRLVAERLTTRLVQAGEFEVIERNRLEAVLRELNLSSSGAVDEKTALRAGRILGAAAAVTGTLARIKDKFEINARVIDIENGRILTGAMAMVDEDSLSVKADDRYYITAPAQQTPPVQPPAARQPRLTQEPPKGWELWPGRDNNYGSYQISGGKLLYRLGARQHDHAWTEPEGKNGYYPGLLLAKPLKGENWTVEFKANYHMPRTSGRWLSACLWLGKDGVRPSLFSQAEDLCLCMFRQADSSSNSDSFVLHYSQSDRWEETKQIDRNTSHFKFTRRGETLKLDYSEDGVNYLNAFSLKAQPTDGKAQKLIFGGQSFSDSNSYAEYENIKINGRKETF